MVCAKTRDTKGHATRKTLTVKGEKRQSQTQKGDYPYNHHRQQQQLTQIHSKE